MNKQVVETAFKRLFPDKKLEYYVTIKFSRKFSPYNANVKKIGDNLIFSFSREWKKVSNEISIGLIQELFLRILRKKAVRTTNIDLYNNFIKSLHLSAKKTETDTQLLEIFNKINEMHFNNAMEAPNLRWGLTSKTRLATYEYHTDTINVSSIFKDADEELIAYLLYHEMLHKKLKFSSSGGRSIHHSREFKKLEKAFENQEELERKLTSFVKSKSSLRINWLRNIF